MQPELFEIVVPALLLELDRCFIILSLQETAVAGGGGG